MTKRISKRISIVLALAVLLSGFAFTMPAHAASKPDLKKANVKWDLKNNKTLKFKTKWSVLGVRKHTVKMTNFKVKDAKKKGYKECTFTLTFNRKISPTKKQVNDMYWIDYDGNAGFGGGFYYTVADYKTGKSLEGKNDKKVKVSDSGWKYSNKVIKSSADGFKIDYYKKASVKVKIVYPKTYKNLAIGVGGYNFAPYQFTEYSGTGAAGGVKTYSFKKYFNGKKAFSKETKLYSKKDKLFAHFMRVK